MTTVGRSLYRFAFPRPFASPGAAGVLLNRSQRFHDLILVIDAKEKRMCDAIDGRRSIAEIIELTGDPPRLTVIAKFLGC